MIDLYVTLTFTEHGNLVATLSNGKTFFAADGVKLADPLRELGIASGNVSLGYCSQADIALLSRHLFSLKNALRY